MEKLLKIDSLAYGGSGVARHDGVVYFVKNGVPGDVLKIKVTKTEKNYREAEIVEVIEGSEHRIAEKCKYANQCGGCQWQHIDYDFQLYSKLKELKSALKKAGIFVPENIIANMAPSPKPWGYRRTAQFKTIKSNNSDELKKGYYSEKSNKLVEIDKCLLLEDKLNKKLQNIKIVDPKIIGFDILQRDDGKVSVSYRYSKFDRSVPFHQVNYSVNHLMVSYIKKFVFQLDNCSSIADLFCGDGNLSLGLSSRASSILGWDYSKTAIKKGNLKAAKKIKESSSCNINYYAANIEKDWNRIGPKISNADLLILDPPRKGIKKLCKKIIDLKIPLIIYVSCSPPDLARDLKKFTDNNYKIQKIKPFDMFPQTYHLETVAILSKKDSI